MKKVLEVSISFLIWPIISLGYLMKMIRIWKDNQIPTISFCDVSEYHENQTRRVDSNTEVLWKGCCLVEVCLPPLFWENVENRMLLFMYRYGCTIRFYRSQLYSYTLLFIMSLLYWILVIACEIELPVFKIFVLFFLGTWNVCGLLFSPMIEEGIGHVFGCNSNQNKLELAAKTRSISNIKKIQKIPENMLCQVHKEIELRQQLTTKIEKETQLPRPISILIRQYHHFFNESILSP